MATKLVVTFLATIAIIVALVAGVILTHVAFDYVAEHTNARQQEIGAFIVFGLGGFALAWYFVYDTWPGLWRK